MNDPEFEEEIEELWRESSRPTSPTDAAERLAHDESRQTAIAHLHMLMQFATGAATPHSADDPARRYDAVLSFLMTGHCLPDPELEPLADAINRALTEFLALPQ